MSDHFELAYVGLEARDRAALDGYLENVVGLARSDLARDYGQPVSVWRLDDKVHRLLVTEGPSDDAAFIGYEYDDEGALRRAVDRLRQLGVEIVEESEQSAAARGVDVLVSTTAPWGTRVELVCGLGTADAPDLPLHPGGFVTGADGLGHVVFTITIGTLPRAREFVVDGLGMRLTDYLAVDRSPVRGEFFHANSRHHSTALIAVPEAPKSLNHIMLETSSIDNVGRSFDRAAGNGLAIPRGLGRHDNDEMFSYYGTTPSGFEIEVGAEGVHVDDSRPVRRYERASAWGHQPYVAAVAS